MPRNAPSCILVNPNAPPEFRPAPHLAELLAFELELRELFSAQAQADDELAARCREQRKSFPAVTGRRWPPFAALHELRQAELRIRLIREELHGR